MSWQRERCAFRVSPRAEGPWCHRERIHLGHHVGENGHTAPVKCCLEVCPSLSRVDGRALSGRAYEEGAPCHSLPLVAAVYQPSLCRTITLPTWHKRRINRSLFAAVFRGTPRTRLQVVRGETSKLHTEQVVRPGGLHHVFVSPGSPFTAKALCCPPNRLVRRETDAGHHADKKIPCRVA